MTLHNFAKLAHIFQGNVPLVVLQGLASTHDLLSLDGHARQRIELHFEFLNIARSVNNDVFECFFPPLNFDCVRRHGSVRGS